MGIDRFLTTVIQAIYGFVGNHGWSIVLFTLLVRFVLMPLDISSRKGMRKMSKIQPKLNALQQKYANDKTKLQQKQSELMKKEGYNPLSGCLPLLIQMPILFAMFAAMRSIANQQIVGQVFDFLAGGQPNYEGWLWVKNIWMADSFFAAVAPDLGALGQIGHDVWHTAFNNLKPDQLANVLANVGPQVQDFAGSLDFSNAEAFKALLPAIQASLKAMPLYLEQTARVASMPQIDLMFIKIPLYQFYNGLLILPVASGLSQLLMTKLNPAATGQMPTAGADGQKQPGMGNFMKYFFPLFSVYITLTSNAGFALYWVTSNLIATAMSYFINLHFDRKDKETAEVVTHLEGSIK